MPTGNIFTAVPQTLATEVFEEIVKTGEVRIERILSHGHASPEDGWYDQEDNEWVMVLQGTGTVLFEDGSAVVLQAGDYINIAAHEKHRVSWTDPGTVTVWLAVFYK